MGQYFKWINLTKHEYLDGWIWPTGYKFYENSHTGCLKTDAACTLLSGRWKGDAVAFVGDYFEGEGTCDHPKRSLAYDLMDECVLDDFIEFGDCKDVAGLFEYARGKSHRPYWWDDRDDDIPYEGPFGLEIEHRRFGINDTRREYFDRKATEVLWVEGERVRRFDPFPALVACGADADEVPDGSENLSGTWIGDAIRFADSAPEGYRDITRALSISDCRVYDSDDVVLLASKDTEYKSLHDDAKWSDRLQKLEKILARQQTPGI